MLAKNLADRSTPEDDMHAISTEVQHDAKP
jgi:hypothetical protein